MEEFHDYKFYKFQKGEMVYVGSTYDWNKRMIKHKSDCNNPNSKCYHYNIYRIMRENGGIKSFKLLEIDHRDQITSRQAEEIEQQYKDVLLDNMGTNKAYTSDAERKIHQRENSNQHYKKNRKAICEKRGEKVECECGCIVRLGDISKHRKTNRHINNIANV